MFNVLTYDNISTKALSRLPHEKYAIAPEVSRPDAILLRSFDLHGVPIPETVLAVARSGTGDFSRGLLGDDAAIRHQVEKEKKTGASSRGIGLGAQRAHTCCRTWRSS